jgi:3-hydroxy-3-methylglutaryl CoA synthase
VERSVSAATVVALGTYAPTWAADGARVVGPDEDTVTMAVAAGRHALSAATAPVDRVVFVTGDPPLLEGGNAPALLAGLGLPASLEVVERLGGAPAALDAVSGAAPGTLVIGADLGRATVARAQAPS